MRTCEQLCIAGDVGLGAEQLRRRDCTQAPEAGKHLQHTAASVTDVQQSNRAMHPCVQKHHQTQGRLAVAGCCMLTRLQLQRASSKMMGMFRVRASATTARWNAGSTSTMPPEPWCHHRLTVVRDC